MTAAMVMASRGLSDREAARAFLECSFPLPDPYLFTAMQAVAGALDEAIENGRKIVVHGDYDADGITATALLQEALGQLGADVDWYLPNRFEEGYGLSRQAMETIAARGARILITVDCGVNYPDEVALARELGMQVIVVDHHEPGPRLPDCLLVHRDNSDYPSADLCGVGLALKLAHALHIHRFGAAREKLPADLMRELDLVALGTIADLAPLTGENRFYVKEGLKLMNLGQRTGIRALAEIAGCTGSIDSGAVAFRLAPRLNAAGRLADPSPPLRLLLTGDEDEARSLATELHELNGTRQELERRVFDEALKLVDSGGKLPTALVLGSPDWHEGVLGIVAARLVERYHRPTVLVSVREGVARGSARSIPGYDLFAGLTECRDLLTVYGGHARAAGLTLSADLVDDFREALISHASAVLSATDLVATYRADAVARGEELGPDTARALAALEPFGTGNPRPRLMLFNASIHDAEATRNGSHVRFRVQQDGVGIPGIAFGMGKTGDVTNLEQRWRIVGGQLRLDEWRGAERVQFVLERSGEDEAPRCVLPSCEARCPEAVEPPGVHISSDSMDSFSQGNKFDMANWPPSGRDLRDRPGRISALAQVIGSGEPTLLLTCSIVRFQGDLDLRVPLDVLATDDLVCISRACTHSAARRLGSVRVIVAEWDVATMIAGSLPTHGHAVALDPPYRPSHVHLCESLAEDGVYFHLLYGDEERTDSARLLRYLLHPRFAMICLYRALQAGADNRVELLTKAAALARDEGGVSLTTIDLDRAYRILDELGLERPVTGKAKLEARKSAAYREAEAEYEECVRLCLTL